MIFQHHRWQVWNKSQHPYYHGSDDIAYTNEAFGEDVSTVGGAIDWIIKVLYPNVQEAVDTPGDLPGSGNDLNDYRVVNDDGDGNPAAYRWEQREGDASAKWYKVADYDWSTDAIISAFEDKTQDLYVYKYGKDDADENGDALTGDSAGQHIYGGASANTHLTLHANAGDGTGAQTGYIQFEDDVRPLTDSAVNLGTNTYRFLNFYTDEANIGTMTITDGSITDSSGTIDFGDEDLDTTGDVTATSFVAGTLTVSDGSIEDSDGLIDFGATDLTTTGDVTAGLVDVDNVRINGNTVSVTNTDGNLNLAANGTGVVDLQSAATTLDITTTGTIDVTGDLAVDNLSLNGNTITTTDTDGDLILSANGAGEVDVQNAMTTLGITATGTVGVTGEITVDNLSLNGNTLSSTDANGNIVIDPNGTGLISVASTIDPDTDDSYDLGETDSRFQDLYLSGSIGDGTNSITMAVLMSLRDINDSVLAGDSIFWDGSQWVSSAPDTEIDHGSISGLGDDDHTQYLLLAGRAGGQTIIGGTAAGDDLLLESTSSGTKGQILIGDDMYPDADATHDLGGSSNQWVDLYMTGQLYGARIENFADSTARGAATGTEGRLAWQVDTEELYIGTGAAWKQITTDRYYNQDAVNWDGSTSQVSYDVSAECDDARTMLWQFKDNTNNYEIMAPAITHTGAGNVTVTFGLNIPAGTYTLVGR